MDRKMLITLLFAALCQPNRCVDGSEDWFADKSFQYLESNRFQNWIEYIYEMQKDLKEEGFILIGTENGIISTDGKIIIQVSGSGFIGFIGFEQRSIPSMMFDGVMGMVQINKTTLVVSDRGRHCLKLVDRLLGKTSVYAGRCEIPGMVNGEARSAQFHNPIGLLMVNSFIYVSDDSNSAIRRVDIRTMVVSTFVKVDRPQRLLLHHTGYLLVSRVSGLTKVFLDSGQAVDLNNSTKTGYRDGNLQSALFSHPNVMQWIADDVFLVADTHNGVIRVINLTSSQVSTLCSADSSSCASNAWSILIDCNTLYVGARGGITAYKLIGVDTTANGPILLCSSTTVQNAVKPSKSELVIGIIVGSSFLVLIIIIIVVIIRVIARRRTRMHTAPSSNARVFPRMISEESIVTPHYTGNIANYSSLEAKLSPDLRLLVEDCKLSNVTLTSEVFIGSGFFGKVCKCQTKREDGSQIMAAVKMLKYKDALISEVENFLKEATTMKTFHHPNVLELLGIIWDQDQPKIVLPLMENGDLKRTLMKEEFNFTVGDLVHFGIQLCSGMEYLESQKYIHRDISARNCMVTSNFEVKIADFGLSVDVYEQEYYRSDDYEKPMPVRWMAIESILEGLYTSKSDWSFGVTMWEILTRGSLPYPAVDSQDIRRCIMLGEQLHRPRFCPDAVHDIMYMCWVEEPGDRPSFCLLSTALKSILNPPGHPADGAAYERVYTSLIRDPDEHHYSSACVDI